MGEKSISKNIKIHYFYRKNKKYLVQNYWLGLNSFEANSESLLTLLQDELFQESSTSIQSYLARRSRLSQNQDKHHIKDTYLLLVY